VIEGSDLWFTYTATCTGTARLSTCHPDYTGRHVISVYRSVATPTVCLCPGDTGFSLLACSQQPQPNQVDPQGCPLLTAADLVINVTQGRCYTVRVSGENATTSPGQLRITCGSAVCGNGAVEAGNGEQCDGNDDSLCAGACDADCRCPLPVCGDGVAVVGLGEQCDGDDDDDCPGFCNPPGHPMACQCPPFCGNGIREPGEFCDDNDDALCPGDCTPPGPGGCTCEGSCGNGVVEAANGEQCDGTDDGNCPGACLSTCMCPSPACGNGVVDIGAGEECDGMTKTWLGSLCDPEQCRAPLDPEGECTCICGPGIEPPPGLEPVSGVMNRFIAFAVPEFPSDEDYAIRVQLVSLHDTTQPPNAQDFSAFEGQYRYLNVYRNGINNPIFSCTDSPTFGTSFACARLTCTPEYRNWFADFGGMTLHIAGDTILPSSTYEAVVLPPECLGQEASCDVTSLAAQATTGRWGDVLPGTLNVLDVAAIVDKVKDQPGAIAKYRAMLQPQTQQPHVALANALDIAAGVDAAKGQRYPFGIIVCP
jgi:hypothetical protein